MQALRACNPTIHALRGKLTLDTVREAVECCPVETALGDPLLLLPCIYMPRRHPTTCPSWAAAIIPHANDFKAVEA